MRTFRYTSRLILAFISKFKGLILIGTIFGVIVFILLNYLLLRVTLKTTQKIGVTGRYHAENLPEEILDLIGDGLTSMNNDATVGPSLAKSWESPDRGKTWIFTIDKSITWHDGENTTSDDIVYEFSDVDIEKPDDKTITFKLKDPYAPFPSIVSRPTFKKGLIGTGGWKVEEIVITDSFTNELVLINEKNDRKKQTIYKFYPTEEQTKLAFKLGEIDIIQNMLNPYPLSEWETVRIETTKAKNQIVTIFFNNLDKHLSDKNLRQALIYSLDKNSFDGERAISPIQPFSWAYNPQVKKYEKDLDRAKELLESHPEETGEFKLTLISSPALLSVAESIVDQWESNLGIKTSILVSSVVPDDFQAYLTILQVPEDPDQYAIWHSTQTNTNNISKYSNPRIDKLLEDGRKELDIDERHKIYLDFQRFLLEDLPAAFLYHPTLYTVMRK